MGQYGQIADLSIVPVAVNGQTYLYYDAQPGQSTCAGQPVSGVLLAVYPGTLHQLVSTDEGAYAGKGGMSYPTSPGMPWGIARSDGFQWLSPLWPSGQGSSVLLSDGPTIDNSTSRVSTQLTMSDVVGGQAVRTQIYELGVPKWLYGMQTSGDYFIYDSTTGQYPFDVTQAGDVTLGEIGGTVKIQSPTNFTRDVVFNTATTTINGTAALNTVTVAGAGVYSGPSTFNSPIAVNSASTYWMPTFGGSVHFDFLGGGYSSKALCSKADKSLGTCSTAIDATGSCTCI